MSYLAQFKKTADDPPRYEDWSQMSQGYPLTLGTWDQALGGALGFCGCGDPETALRYIRDLLRLIGERGPDSFAPGGMDQWNEWYKGHRAKVDAFFHDDRGAEYLAYYLLDDKGLTEHGGSVPGWLTPKGKDILADLEAHSAELDDEAPTPTDAND